MCITYCNGTEDETKKKQSNIKLKNFTNPMSYIDLFLSW